MLAKGPAKKVTIYLNDDTRHHIEPVWSVIFNFLKQKKIAGATVLRPFAGFGSHGVVHDTESEYRSDHLPIRIEFVESAATVDELLPALYDMVSDGLIETQDVNIVKAVAQGTASEPSPSITEVIASREGPFPAKLVRIYLGESDTRGGEPLYEAIVRRLKMMDFAGATVYRGILGYGVKRHTHRSGMLPFSRDLPVMITVVERVDRIEELLNVVTGMMQDGLVAISDVEMFRTIQASGIA